MKKIIILGNILSLLLGSFSLNLAHSQEVKKEFIPTLSKGDQVQQLPLEIFRMVLAKSSLNSLGRLMISLESNKQSNQEQTELLIMISHAIKDVFIEEMEQIFTHHPNAKQVAMMKRNNKKLAEFVFHLDLEQNKKLHFTHQFLKFLKQPSLNKNNLNQVLKNLSIDKSHHHAFLKLYQKINYGMEKNYLNQEIHQYKKISAITSLVSIIGLAILATITYVTLNSVTHLFDSVYCPSNGRMGPETPAGFLRANQLTTIPAEIPNDQLVQACIDPKTLKYVDPLELPIYQDPTPHLQAFAQGVGSLYGLASAVIFSLVAKNFYLSHQKRTLNHIHQQADNQLEAYQLLDQKYQTHHSPINKLIKKLFRLKCLYQEQIPFITADDV